MRFAVCVGVEFLEKIPEDGSRSTKQAARMKWRVLLVK